MNIVKRSETPTEMAFSVERQAPGGNWVRVLGTNDRDSAESYAQFEADSQNKPNMRVVLEHE